MPTILHMPSEAEIFEVDKTQMLSICFCCECCCDVRLLLREGPDRYWDLYNQRMPGLEVVISENCTGYGECVEACYGGERVITINEQQALIHERCIGCGKCVTACPEGVISMVFVPEVHFMRALREKISERVWI
jgi:UDP-glucose 4-epimerase